MAWSLHNIERASCDYKCVRAIKLSPHLGTLEAIPIASNSSGGLTKVPLVWNQMFSLVKELRLQPGLSSTASRVPSATAKDVEDRLMALLPRLDNLHELFIVDQHQRNVFPDNLVPGPCSTTTLAFACFAPRLTLLSLNLFSQVILCSYLPDRNSFSLPLLQIFRVKFSKYTFPSENDQAAVMGLIQKSPLLMELEYSIADSDWAWSQHLILLADPLLHPKLRVFKWATEQEYFYENTTVAAPLLPGLTKFLTLFNAQLRVLHFNPALSAGMGALLNFTLLSELHLDLTFCSTIEQEKLVSVHLPSAPCLCILELRGETVPFTRFGKLIPLKKFYLCISATTFAWNLALLAGIAPNLRFLNVVFNQGKLGVLIRNRR
ncbi:hypothetical protein DL96DRAFT_1065678 [Flagelloscypha sp. PMI_526]|nr:hypothetical protein DL96DRAFT_1065678 [Flagelloscypha sp. PMI_526]